MGIHFIWEEQLYQKFENVSIKAKKRRIALGRIRRMEPKWIANNMLTIEENGKTQVTLVKEVHHKGRKKKSSGKKYRKQRSATEKYDYECEESTRWKTKENQMDIFGRTTNLSVPESDGILEKEKISSEMKEVV